MPDIVLPTLNAADHYSLSPVCCQVITAGLNRDGGETRLASLPFFRLLNGVYDVPDRLVIRGNFMLVPAMQSNPAPAKFFLLAAIRSCPPTGLLAALLALLTMVLYWPVLQNDFINYDDGLYVTANVHVQNGLTWEGVKWAFGHTVSCNWHPLTVLSHMLDCQLYGLKQIGRAHV